MNVKAPAVTVRLQRIGTDAEWKTRRRNSQFLELVAIVGETGRFRTAISAAVICTSSDSGEAPHLFSMVQRQTKGSIGKYKY